MAVNVLVVLLPDCCLQKVSILYHVSPPPFLEHHDSRGLSSLWDVTDVCRGTILLFLPKSGLTPDLATGQNNGGSSEEGQGEFCSFPSAARNQ